jgi:hypothetical protein
VLGVKTTGDHVRTYPELIAEMKAEISSLKEKIAQLQAIIDKQLY